MISVSSPAYPATQEDLISCMYTEHEDKLSRIHRSKGFHMILGFKLTMTYSESPNAKKIDVKK